ncbi:hypothetical protein BLNAU_14936 [Blattamonas nauphoetae]|uniref:Transposase n=1 Tax=Blattamonas nauphoetae TaxID=2049346 RepID=A0ABQ9XEL5_9EUKA|nr:hypothetical protein BLNAU_14936 [Blattamonas nauphoetae]
MRTPRSASSLLIVEHTLADSTIRGWLRKGHSCRIVDGRMEGIAKTTTQTLSHFDVCLVFAFLHCMLLVLAQLVTSKQAFADSPKTRAKRTEIAIPSEKGGCDTGGG